MGHGELIEWAAFYQIEPFGVVRDNLHSAMIVSLLYNVHKAKGKPSKNVDDFLIRDSYEVRKQGEQDFLSMLRANAKRKQ